MAIFTVALAKLWAAVKYFHPHPTYRDDIDWDEALARSILKVDAAKTADDYSAAVASLLVELGDPATYLRNAVAENPANPTPSTEHQPTYRMTEDGVLVVTMTNYADLMDFVVTREKLQAIKKEIPHARSVVFDLRPSVIPFEGGMASYSLSESGLTSMMIASPLAAPGERRRIFELSEKACAPADLSSQSVIGEINLLTIMILVRAPSLAVGALERCGDNGFSKIFLPGTAS